MCTSFGCAYKPSWLTVISIKYKLKYKHVVPNRIMYVFTHYFRKFSGIHSEYTQSCRHSMYFKGVYTLTPKCVLFLVYLQKRAPSTPLIIQNIPQFRFTTVQLQYIGDICNKHFEIWHKFNFLIKLYFQCYSLNCIL